MNTDKATDTPPQPPAVVAPLDRGVRPLRHESARLKFLERRDGHDGAQDFARRTLLIYRAAVKRGKDGRRSGYGSAYRRALVESCLDFRTYLRPNGAAKRP
jgi:hypothetical protein